MLTRRGFLVAGGLGLGALAATAYAGNGLAADHGIDLGDELRDALGRGSRVDEHSFASTALGTEVTWLVIAPRGVALDGLPMALALHGRGGHAWDAVGWLKADDALQDHADSGGAPFAIVAVDGGDHSYYHPRSDGTDALAMLTDELLPRAADVGLDTARIGAIGWSMGGFGALMLARESAQGRLDGTEVVAAVANGAALWTSAGLTAEGAFDDPSDFARWGDLVAHPGVGGRVPLRVDSGEDDPFAAVIRRYRAAVVPTPEGGFVPGGHDGATWRPLLPAQLAFLADHLVRT